MWLHLYRFGLCFCSCCWICIDYLCNFNCAFASCNFSCMTVLDILHWSGLSQRITSFCWFLLKNKKLNILTNTISQQCPCFDSRPEDLRCMSLVSTSCLRLHCKKYKINSLSFFLKLFFHLEIKLVGIKPFWNVVYTCEKDFKTHLKTLGKWYLRRPPP